jgi:hypothetical protein
MILAAPSSAPGACVGALDWSAPVAAPSQSTLSGVLAGFVFGGIVVLLSVRVPSRGAQAAEALKLLFSAFFGLAVVAYLLADQAADTDCLRAISEETLAGGILGTFAVVMIVSLTWLVVSYELHDHGVLRFLHHLIYFACFFVTLLLCTSSYSYLQAQVRGGPVGWMVLLIYLAGGLLYLIALPAGSRAAALLPLRLSRPTWIHIVRAHGSAVDRCVWAALGYLAVAAAADSYVLGVAASEWSHPVIPVAYLVGWGSLILPMGVLILAVHALAPSPPAPVIAVRRPMQSR